MPVPLAPYPSPPVPYTPPAPAPQPLPPSAVGNNGSQGQLVCSGCRNLLLYPAGATSVCCAVCSAVTAVPPPGTEMAQLICGGCHTLLMYIRGAMSVQCSCCHTVNLALEANQVAHVNCGNCRMLLMYQYGARSVKCAVCNFVTSVGYNRSVNSINEMNLMIDEIDRRRQRRRLQLNEFQRTVNANDSWQPEKYNNYKQVLTENFIYIRSR
ncbi:hypothetical protein QQ045_002615 [Rhodiola kirilowii]